MIKKKLRFLKGKKNINVLNKERYDLIAQVNDLQRQIYQLQLEKDVLEKAAEALKKIRVSLFKH